MAIHRKILRWLENELFEGNIQLGQDLPSDSEIARAIGVSRSRTREALRTLEDMDLVQLYNGRGKEMLVHLSDEPAAAASAALRLHMSSSRYPTRDLVQTRILLESWAIARIDPKTTSFAEMDEVLEQMEDFDLSIRDFLELLLTFHHQVMRCAGNELLVGLLASVRQPSFESMLSLVGRMPLWSSAVERLRAESRAIAEALKAGDSATARAMVIGQLRGMYSDAGIDLEQEATSANGLPGEPIASEFAPVDVDEFAADDFDDLMQDDASFADVGALPAADAPVAAPAELAQVPAPVSAQSADVEYEQSESEAARVEVAHVEEAASGIPSEPTDTSAETTSGADISASDKVERSIPAASQPVPAAASAAPAQPTAHTVSADVPLSFGTPRRSTPVAQVTPAASAAPVASVAASSQTLASQPLSSQTPSGQLPSVPAAYAQEEVEGPAKVLRASTAAPRRRSGQIISPVRATIIKPVDRSKVLTAPARTARPAAVVTAAAPAESESAEKVLRAPARQEVPAVQPAEPTRLEAAATIHDTYEKLPHDEPVQERGGIFSKMKRFFGVDVYEPNEAQESAEKDQAVKEQVLKAETKPEPQPEPQPVIDEEALARAEAERAERLKALHAAAEEEAAEESAVEEVSVEEPVEEPAEASDPAQESAAELVEAASPAEESAPDAAVASSGSVLSHGRAKGSKKSKKKRR
ncbi:GntR family transcriptional regulator [Rothia sp. HMSC071C12]|uniref:FadR/GntR family transcriptional regulator n=1 Tax=Rothia sp. HMSC071C12 TaxID=1739446 RepID=UPI0008A440AC|nr:FCD domain-containing protein [Rothia sp. HMSC071C12]OFQ35844.1 GntR family transcriptional regulator [Rothia sp. HMSC071C12]